MTNLTKDRGVAKNQLIHGEAIEEMAKLPDMCIDAVICDPPY